MSAPRVGVVVPAYQSERFVAEAVRSVLAQTHADLGVVVIDDGSTDRTAEVVSAIDDRRVQLLSQANAGVARARNVGATRVDGELLAFLDADDLWAPTKLAEQVAALQAHPDWACVGTLMHHVDESGRVLGVTGEAVDELARGRVASAELLPCPVSSLLFRRSAFEELGGFDEDLVVHVPAMVEDLDLMARLAVRHPFGVLPRVLGGYRVHGGSGSAVHFRNQREGARFVRARMRAGGDLSWAQFQAARQPSVHRWRTDTGAYLYRSAGLAAAERRRAAMLARGAGALLLTPAYTVQRLGLQRGRMVRGRD